MNDRRLSEESNLTARQPHRAQHHVKQAKSPSERLAQGPYVVTRVGFELRTCDLANARHQTYHHANAGCNNDKHTVMYSNLI